VRLSQFIYGSRMANEAGLGKSGAGRPDCCDGERKLARNMAGQIRLRKTSLDYLAATLPAAGCGRLFSCCAMNTRTGAPSQARIRLTPSLPKTTTKVSFLSAAVELCVPTAWAFTSFESK
jgi:hypothetical protein